MDVRRKRQERFPHFRTPKRGALAFLRRYKKGESNAVKKQPKWLFLNGDRRLLCRTT